MSRLKNVFHCARLPKLLLEDCGDTNELIGLRPDENFGYIERPTLCAFEDHDKARCIKALSTRGANRLRRRTGG